MVKLDYDNLEQVENYLIYKLSNNKLFKGYSFYKNIAKLYDYYPKTIENIVANIPKFSYYKDYFRILNESKNENLNAYIYELLLTQIKLDIEKYNKNEPISTLAKWLPRKGREFDIKLNFVNKFVELLYQEPNGKKMNRIVMFRKYKKTVADLTRTLNPIEHNLCSKQYDKIDFENLTGKNHQTYNQKLKKEFGEGYLKYSIEQYNQLDFHQFTKKVLWLNNLNDHKKKLYNDEIKIIQDIWKNNFEKFDNLNYNLSSKYLVVDFSSGLLNSMKLELVKFILLSINKNKFIIINKKRPVIIKTKENIFDTINSVYEKAGLALNISIKEIDNLVKESGFENKNYMIVTEKPYSNIKNNGTLNFDYIKLENVKFTQLEKNIYTGNPFYIATSNKNNLIYQIIEESGELNKKIKIFKKMMYITFIILNIYLFFKFMVQL